jgi:hypothetical protein
MPQPPGDAAGRRFDYWYPDVAMGIQAAMQGSDPCWTTGWYSCENEYGSALVARVGGRYEVGFCLADDQERETEAWIKVDISQVSNLADLAGLVNLVRTMSLGVADAYARTQPDNGGPDEVA